MKPENGRILERLLDPVCSSLNGEAAYKLIGVQADAKARIRVDELARKCNKGGLRRRSGRSMKATSWLATSSPFCTRRHGSCRLAAADLHESRPPALLSKRRQRRYQSTLNAITNGRRLSPTKVDQFGSQSESMT